MQFVITAHDGAGMLEKRMSVRARHLENLAGVDGRVICGGGILNGEGELAGSVLIMDFASRERLEEYLKNEPYVQAGVWEDIRIEPINVVLLNGEKVGK